MINVVGIDVGRNGFVAVALDSFVPNPLKWFGQHHSEIVWLGVNQEGLDVLEAFNPAALVMEPTGVWYSAFLKEWAFCKGIPVYWVGHADLAAQRASYGFQNKRDDEDALSLALTYFDQRFIDRHGRKRFLNFESGAVMQLRQLFLELEQIDKAKNGLVNQVRQRLCREFPEAATRRTEINPKLGFSPLWGYLASIYSYTSILKLHNSSVARQIGIDISPFTAAHSKAICELEKRHTLQEAELTTLLNQLEFQPYLKVLRRFGFGLRNQALLLTQIYPFAKFLVNGEPWIEWELPPPRRSKGKQHLPKPQKRPRSQRSFQAYLGLSYKLKQSGDSLQKKFLGSDIVRSHLYMWAVDYLRRPPENTNLNSFILSKDPKRGHVHAYSRAEEFQKLPLFRLDTTVGQTLNSKLIELEYDGVKGSDKVLRLLFRTTALLFQELCKELL